jgi:glyoxylase-like metal-dependent hydrolase (beta-lactamase superfamily II)
MGAVEITRVVEWYGVFGPIQTIVPESDPELRRANEAWLAPDHWHPEDDTFVAAAQTWVLRSEGRTILVDTGIGEDKSHGLSPRTDFLARLGVAPSEVDLVINTHVHYDHVGWNTTLADGEWVPTFPNARYLIPKADNEFFHPSNAPRDLDRMVYKDSVAPLHGLVDLWDGRFQVDGTLTLESAPGHTPGSSVLRLESGGDRAVFVGDMLHSPLQVLEPLHNSCFCLDPVQARATRTAVLGRAADEGALVVPAHFGGHGALTVSRDASRFRISGWAGFEIPATNGQPTGS